MWRPYSRDFDADGGPVQPQSHLRRDADAARMRDALSVEHDQVKLGLQFLPRSQNRRTFTKGQQDRDAKMGYTTLPRHADCVMIVAWLAIVGNVPTIRAVGADLRPF